LSIKSKIITILVPVIAVVVILAAMIPLMVAKGFVEKSVQPVVELSKSLTGIKDEVEVAKNDVLKTSIDLIVNLSEAEANIVNNWLDSKISLIDKMKVDESIDAAFAVFQPTYINFALSNYTDYLEKGYTKLFLALPNGKAYDVNGKEYKLPKNVTDRVVNEKQTVVIVPFKFSDQKESQFLVIAPFMSADNSLVKGIVGFTFPQKDFINFLNNIRVGKTGYAHVINNDGLTISHPKASLINSLNIQKDKDLNVLYKAAKSGKEKYVFYKFQGKEKFAAIAPLKYGLYMFVGMQVSEVTGKVEKLNEVTKSSQNLVKAIDEFKVGFQKAVKKSILTGILFALIGVVFVVVIIYFSAESISKPLRKLAVVSDKLDSGDLTVEIPTVKGDTKKDEIVNLSKSFAKLKETLRNIIGEMYEVGNKVEDISKSLSEMVQDTMTKSEEAISVMDNMKRRIDDVTQSAQSANSGMEEISAGAQSLADYASELSNISNDMKNTSDETKDVMRRLGTAVNNVKEIMRETIQSMDELLNLSNRINQIVETISSIAEQTNLLALNAAIEAARAGEAGKGFAVVADEIRKLAEESRKSTDEIASILSQIRDQALKIADDGKKLSESVDESVDMVGSSVKALEELAARINRVSEMTVDLANTSQEQSAAATEVSQAIDSIAKELVEVEDEAKRIVDFLKETTDAVMNVNQQAENLESYVVRLTEYLKRFKI